MGESQRSGWRTTAGVIAALALFLSPSTASAAAFGDVEVVVESEPKGASTHGYAEVWVRVTNRSPSAARTVRLTFPKSTYSPGADYLRSVTRTVTVEAGKSARVAIAFPEKLPLGGSGLGVAVDGRDYDEAISLGFLSRGSGSSRSSYAVYGYGGRGSVPTSATVLYSRAVDTRFPDWVSQAHASLRFGGLDREPELPGGRSIGSLAGLQIDCVRADQPATAWSPNWLGYTRYDGVVVTAEDMRTMPAEARGALGQYVECGGSLLVLGPGAPLPGPWKPQRLGKLSLSVQAAGFGDCLVTDHTDLSGWRPEPLLVVMDSWARTLNPWQREHTPAEANRVFPIVDDVGVPVKGLLALMFVFALVIGPINLFVLARKKRKLWQFWTVPLVSLVTCLSVFAYMALTEGWKGRARVEGFTVLDENTRRASTIGWTAFYTPLLPGGGLRFSPGTEVAYQNSEDHHGAYYGPRRRSSSAALTIDWSSDQHLASGWLTPRVPAHFVVRKGETRRERVTITRAGGGFPEAVNGLGADVTDLWYADEQGNLYRGGPIPAGGRATLQPATRPEAPPELRTLRDVYTGEWTTLATRMRSVGPALLTPRTYLAVMDAAPFLDDGLPKASVRKTRSVVLGILREGGDEG